MWRLLDPLFVRHQSIPLTKLVPILDFVVIPKWGYLCQLLVFKWLSTDIEGAEKLG